MHVDVLNRNITVHEIFLIHYPPVEWNQVFNTRDDSFIQRCTHASDSILTVVAPNKEFR